MNSAKRSIFLIRHGESEHNLALKATRLENGSVNLDTKFSEEYIDALMTKTGREQAEKAQPLVQDKNIKYVICSPIRRCIETAQIVFKGHKNSPKILIDPLIRELVCCAADLGSSLDDVESMFVDIDFTPMSKYEHRHVWDYHDHFDEETRLEILEEIKRISLSTEEKKDIRKLADQFVLKKMRGLYPKYLESWDDTRKRADKSKEVLNKLLSTLKEDETVALVSHHGFCKVFTATKFNENAVPIDGEDLNNCQVYEYVLESQ